MDTYKGNRRFTAFGKNIQTIFRVLYIGNDTAKIITGVREWHYSVNRNVDPSHVFIQRKTAPP